MTTETRRTWCGLCHSRCGLLIDLVDGQAVALHGDPEHPTSRGRTCERGRMMLEHLHHPERVNHPLRRAGERGAGQWERVSWAQALDEVAQRLSQVSERYGAEALAVTRGTYRTYHWDARRFLNLFGSPNLTGVNPICHCPSVFVESAMAGAKTSPDLGRAACAVLWGSARSVSSPVTHWPAIAAASKRGARLIAVDPRRTREAELADIWLQPRPGTDLALMLSWIHVICAEGLYDREFVERHTSGFDAVRSRALDYPPSRAAAITWVPQDDIVRAARLYATTRPAVITWGQGIDKLGPNTDGAIQARTVLRAITGNLDVEGGERLGWAERPARVISEQALEMNHALPSDQRAKQLGGDRYRLFSFDAWERLRSALARVPAGALQLEASAEIVIAHPHDVYGAMRTGQPYPVRALLCQAANPLVTLADPLRTLGAIRSLDLVVVMDYYLTPTAAMADYVFPAAGTVERDDLSVFASGIIAQPRALDPLFERRSDYELWMELGRRLGQAEHWPWQTAEAVCDHRLSPAGLTFSELKAARAVFDRPTAGRFRKTGFATPSGKVELSPSILTNLGCDPLPAHRPPARDTDERYPLVLITGSAFNPMYHSEQRQWPSARRRCPEPLVSLHPQTAAALGIADGQWVRIETAVGSIRQRARLCTDIHPRMADSQHGWWFPERSCDPETLYGVLEANVNALCRDAPADCAAGTGAWTQTGIACRIAPENHTA